MKKIFYDKLNLENKKERSFNEIRTNQNISLLDSLGMEKIRGGEGGDQDQDGSDIEI